MAPCCSTQLIAILSPGLFSKPYTLALSFHLYLRNLISDLGVQGGCMDHMCMSHSVLPATDWLLCFSLRLWSSFPVLLVSTVRGLPRSHSLPFTLAPSLGHRCWPASTSFFFFFILPGYVEIPLVLSGVWVLLPVFSRHPVRIAPFVDDFWCICGKRWAPHPLPPSWSV